MKKYEDFEKEAASYQLILQRYKKTGVLYEDPNFHPKRKIKENKVKFDGRDIVWNRVDKYFKSPLYENISKDAVQQGELGDCYFISTLSRIGKQKELVKLLFDPISDVKCGAVIVYFYAYGRRTPILIDTLLPFKLGTRTPIFSHPSDFTYSAWFTLVEKAFAKLNGSYSNIVSGQFAHAVYSLFGYHPFSKTIENIKGNPFDKLMKYQRIGALIGTSIHSTTKASQEEIQKNGLVQNHSYLVLKARTVEGKNFLCLRNPWGNDREWLGDWSDTSELWTPSLKKALGVKFGNDGSFWMIDKDFYKYFTDLGVSKPVNPRWHCRSFHTQLKPGPHDGRQYTDPGSKMAQRDTYVFRIDSDEAIKIYIRCEKRASPDYESSKLQILLCNTKGQKITPEIIPYCSRQTFTTSNEITGFSKMIEKPKEEGWTIVILRTTAMKVVEDVYVQLYCEKDFTLYNVDTPNVLIPEDEKTGILFDNSSVRHPNVAPTLKTIPINGKDVQVLSSLRPGQSKTITLQKAPDNSDEEESDNEYDSSVKQPLAARNKLQHDLNAQTILIQSLQKKLEAERQQYEVEKNKFSEDKKKLENDVKKIGDVKRKLDESKNKLISLRKKTEEDQKLISTTRQQLDEEKKNFEAQREEDQKKIEEAKRQLINDRTQFDDEKRRVEEERKKVYGEKNCENTTSFEMEKHKKKIEEDRKIIEEDRRKINDEIKKIGEAKVKIDETKNSLELARKKIEEEQNKIEADNVGIINRNGNEILDTMIKIKNDLKSEIERLKREAMVLLLEAKKNSDSAKVISEKILHNETADTAENTEAFSKSKEILEKEKAQFEATASKFLEKAKKQSNASKELQISLHHQEAAILQYQNHLNTATASTTVPTIELPRRRRRHHSKIDSNATQTPTLTPSSVTPTPTKQTIVQQTILQGDPQAVQQTSTQVNGAPIKRRRKHTAYLEKEKLEAESKNSPETHNNP